MARRPLFHGQREYLRQLLAKETTFATTLLVLLVDQYGQEALQWTPETIRMELEDDFNIRVPALTIDKIATAISILTSDDFYVSLPKFIVMCNTLNDVPYDPTMLDLADPEECAWGAVEAMTIWPTDKEDKTDFSEEIKAYVRAIVDAYGLTKPPAILRTFYPEGYTSSLPDDFSMDPEMSQAISVEQQGLADDIDAAIKERVEALANEIHSLPLVSVNSPRLDSLLG